MPSLERTERSPESGERRPGSGKDAGGSDAAGRAEREELEAPPDRGDASERMDRGTHLEIAVSATAENAGDPGSNPPPEAAESDDPEAKRRREESNARWEAEKESAIRRMREHS